ncbi:hypothetical protein BS78_04G149600 [Paspalum vaginatum]|nr:hypothetical protein BS78_04G149600 [Paspalum vaginatum]
MPTFACPLRAPCSPHACARCRPHPRPSSAPPARRSRSSLDPGTVPRASVSEVPQLLTSDPCCIEPSPTRPACCVRTRHGGHGTMRMADGRQLDSHPTPFSVLLLFAGERQVWPVTPAAACRHGTVALMRFLRRYAEVS